MALARALVNYPSALLLDEPLGALDLKLRQAMQLELKRIQREVGITFVYVTHDQEEALTMSDRIAVMSEGRVEQIASPTDIYDEPATVFVAGFIGQANLWPATLQSQDGDTAILTALGSTLEAWSNSTLSGDITLMVRPERVRVAADEATAPDGAVPATITSLVFQGPVMRLAADAQDGTEVIAHVGPEQRLPLLRPGDGVWVSWDRDAATALPGRPGDAPPADLEDLLAEDADAEPPAPPRAISRRAVVGGVAAAGVVAAGAAIWRASEDDSGGGGDEASSSTTEATGAAAGPATESDTLRISNWPFYIDEETVGLFEDESGLTVQYTEDVNDNEEYFSRIREPLSRNQDVGSDLFIVTDFLVARLINLGWLAPIDDANVPNKSNLVSNLSDVAYDPERRYSLPWFSGFTSIAYNRDLVSREITSLNDLFDEEFAGQVTFFSDLRDGLGLVMLSDGNSPAEATEEMIQQAVDKVAQAKSDGQIRRFTGNDYGDDLVAGNVAISMAYSGDVATLKGDNPALEFVVPEEGMLQFSDNMVMPTSTANSVGAQEWMNYVYDPENMARIAAYVQYIPPVEGAGELLPERLRSNPLIVPPSDYTDAAVIWRALTDEEDQQFSSLYADVARA